MTRYGMVIGLKPETEQKYKEYHAAVWPGVLAMISKCNIRNYSIYLRDHTLYAYFEYHGTDYAADMARDGCGQDHAGVVGDHGADAEPRPQPQRRRVVVAHGRGFPSGLRPRGRVPSSVLSDPCPLCENREQMLSLQNAGKRFGPRVLFLEANWLIRAREKTALVGANGTGKSTLMKVLAGLETLDYGEVQQTRGMSIGYLPQEGLRLTGRTVFEECLTVFDELREMEREIERLGGQLAVLDHEGAGVRGRGGALLACCRSAFTRWMATRWMRRWAAC